ncbi:ARV1 family protein [bacterium]|nr:ARV1 family protein [bacterium]
MSDIKFNCRHCTKELVVESEHAGVTADCPHCQKPVTVPNVSGADKYIQFEVGKKSGAVAALLNLVIPGAGYMYCGRVALGVIVLITVPFAILVTGGFALLVTVPAMVVDGVMCAGRSNKALAEKLA